MMIALTLGAGVAMAQPIDLPEMPRIDIMTHTPEAIYVGQSVVRVRTTTQAQLEAVLDLTESVWSERTGVGLLDVQIRRDHLPTLTKMGVGYDILIPDLQAHHDARWNQMRAIVLNDPDAQRGAWTHNDAWFSNYKQFAEIITYFNDIAAARPDIASMADIGDSLLSNDIYALTITGPETPDNPRADRPVVLWHGAQHAREWVSPMTVSYLASRFVADYGSDPRITDIVNNNRLVIVPVMNPDGYLYTWSTERFWRKNRRNNGGGTFGVDLNRNWGYEWGGQGASGNPSNDTYHGTGPFSEPETQVMRDLAISYGDHLVAHIDYHTYSQLILWPFGYAAGVQTPEPDRTFYDNLATAMSDEILAFSGVFYDPIQAVDLYPAAGDSSDWFYGELGAKSLTIELRPSSNAAGGFDPPPSTILPTAQENYEAAKLFVERTTLPFTFAFDADEIVEADTPTQVTLGISDLVATHDPASVQLLTRIGTSGDFTSTPMTALGNDRYAADLPPAPCGSSIFYSFSVETTDSQTVSFPSTGDFSALAQQFFIAFEDDMESDTGWAAGEPGDTATTGIWERAIPEPTDAQPGEDRTPGGGVNCWITGAAAGTGLGDNDVDSGFTTLTTPMFDLTQLGPDAELRYWRWYSNDRGASPNDDQMFISISNDAGFSWRDVEEVSENTNAWVERRFRIADLIEPTSTMLVRFIAADFGSGSIVEAGIDDLRILSVGCDTNPADLNGDGNLDFFDISAFLSAFNDQDPIADFNNDGNIDFFDVSAFLKAFGNG